MEDNVKREKKRRRFPLRHKSNEMVENSTPEKTTKIYRLSNSFAGYDYKGHVVLQKRNSTEKETDGK